MRTLGLLLVALVLPLVAGAQEADAPEGSIIDAVEMSGFSPYDLSPGLQKDMNGLLGVPLSRRAVDDIAARIEAEQPEVIAAYRAISRPDNRARVVFMVARISEDASLVENINARYTVEGVEISGVPEEDVSQALRDALQALVGRRLDHDEAERLEEKIAAELPGHEVRRRISRGTEPGRIRVVFEVTEIEIPWIRFARSRSKFVYQEDLGWSGVLDIPMGGRDHRFTLGLVLGNDDDLIEEYGGFRLRVESRKLATERLGASLEISRLRQSWDDTTLSALAGDPSIPGPYRTRVTAEPSLTFAVSPGVRLFTGASLSGLDPETASASTLMANAWVAGIGVDRLWDGADDFTHRVEAGYQARFARDGLGSDLVYTRHLVHARYRFEQGHSAILVGFSAGSTSGEAPLFERFSLGDTSTLRGWNKYDVSPAGGGRMFHQSLEYRYRWAAAFLDVGSVWDRAADRLVRWSTGFGLHGDNVFLTAGFPVNADGARATFLMGVRF
jgi:hypothetical protein